MPRLVISHCVHCMLVAALAIVVLWSAPCLAHDDDPKLRDLRPRYEGPGYSASAAAGAPAQVEGQGFPAVGVSLRSWLPVGDFGSATGANDCWGYVSPSGREYAILGLSNGTAFVEVTDPDDPTIIGVHDGPNSLWRDIKVYQSHAYVVTEGTGAGIQIFDLSQIDTGIIPPPRVLNSGGVTDTHNVIIDETSGFLYRAGGGNGLRIYSLANPTSPAFVGDWEERYVHDAQVVTYETGPYAGRQIAFCCGGFNNGWVETGIDILDVTNKSNVQLLARVSYDDAVYAHQAWLSEDRRYLYVNDEEDEGEGLPSTTIVMDVTDLENPFETTRFTNGNTASTHNLYVHGDLIYAANYRSGMRIFDATDPLAPVEIAYFDTWPEDDASNFNGLWSTYPYFPSGTVIGSDIQKGLFVWRVPVTQLEITFPDGLPALLAPDGATLAVQIDESETGALARETATLHFDAGSAGGDFAAVPLEDLGDGAFGANFPALPCGTLVRYYVSVRTIDGDLLTSPSGAPDLAVNEVVVADASATRFVDDMEQDLGWFAVSVGATTGQWQRGVPVDDPQWPYDPAADGDGSGRAWLTENQVGNTDVDGGSVQLFSPSIDMEADDVLFRYQYFLTLAEEDGTDGLFVEMSDVGMNGPWTLMDVHATDGNLAWRANTITGAAMRAAGLDLTDSMRVRFTAVDGGAGTIVEAGVDGVEVVGLTCPSVCPGDLDGDGAIGFGDVTSLLAGWGACSSCPADLNGNGVIGFEDLTTLLNGWGPCP